MNDKNDLSTKRSTCCDALLYRSRAGTAARCTKCKRWCGKFFVYSVGE